MRAVKKELLWAAVCAAPVLVGLNQKALAVAVTWAGGTGTWGDSTKWSGGVVPNNTSTTTFDVSIDAANVAASTVDLNFGGVHTTTINTLAISTGDALNIDDGDRLNLVGTSLVNAGTISLKSTGDFTNLNVPSVILGGGGYILMSNNAQNNIRAQSGNARFTNNDNTIEGSGNIGNDQAMLLSNHGTIIANQSTQLQIILAKATNQSTNTGVIKADGATLNLLLPNFSNNGGTIAAINGGTVLLSSNSFIDLGTFTTSGGGVIQSNSLNGTVPPTLADITNTGNITIPNAKVLNFIGSITNSGSINIASISTMILASDATFSGGGAINLDNNDANLIEGMTGNERLTNVNNTISGAGRFGAGLMNFTNSGTLIASGSAGLKLQPKTDAANNSGGVWQANAGSTLSLLSTSFTNDGSIIVQAGGSLTLGGPTGGATLSGKGSLNNAGTFTNYGTATIPPITGDGTVIINAGTITITHSSGTSIVKSLTIASSGKFNLINNNMVIDYDNAAALPTSPSNLVRTMLASGGLFSSQANSTTAPGKTALGYEDTAGSTITSFSGQTVDDSAVLIKYTYAGDTNLDGQVDATDLGNLATNWQNSGFWINGDFNYDGSINITDLGILASNWQQGVGNPLAPQSFQQALAELGLPGFAVPEPSTLAATLSLAIFLKRRR